MTGEQIGKLRELGMRVIWDFHGDWYSWAGAVPGTFDCSGASGEYLKAVGLLPRQIRITADAQWRRFKAGTVPERDAAVGDLVFWFDTSGVAKHVEIIALANGGELYSIGASGGGPNTKTREDAIRDNAFVKVRPVATREGTWKVVNPYLGLLT